MLPLFLRGQDVRIVRLQWKSPEMVGKVEPNISTIAKGQASTQLGAYKQIAYVQSSNALDTPENGQALIFPFSQLHDKQLKLESFRLLNMRGSSQMTAESKKRTRLFAIYNPGRGEGLPPARLLEIGTPPPIPEHGKDPFTVWATVLLGRKGEVKKVTVDPGAEAAVVVAAEATVKKWKFSEPWKTNDQGEAEVRVPVHFPVSAGIGTAKKGEWPVMKESPDRSLADVGMLGKGSFWVRISPEGRVSAVTIIASDRPSFAERQIDYYFKTKWDPALRDNKAVAIEVLQRHGGAMMIMSSTGESARVVTSQGAAIDSGAAPAGERKYDTTPVLVNLPAGAFPFELAQKGIGGVAEYVITVDKDGEVPQPDAIAAPNEELRMATRAMLDAYRFQPATLDNKPVKASFKAKVVFGLREGDVSLSKSARRILQLLNENPASISPEDAADHAPEQIVFLKPFMPGPAWCPATGGTAEIEFYIDEQGRAQLPRIVAASAPAFGYAAAQAVVMWHFKPVTVKDRPAIVRVRKKFEFPRDTISKAELLEGLEKAGLSRLVE